jgi:hypothetical protein
MVLIKVFSKNPVVGVFAQPSSILRRPESLIQIASACDQHTALGLHGSLGDDVDHSVHCVSSPDRPPGPRITSIRSMSSSGRSNVSHKTPPKVGVYTVRPSTMTSTSLLKRPFNPRTLMAHVLASICATSTPGTMRSTSGMVVAPERAMSAAVMTKMAEAARDIFCAVLDTELTLVFMRSSRLRLVRSEGIACGQAGRNRKNSIANWPNLRPAFRARPLFEDSLDSPCGLMTPIPLRKEILQRVDAEAVFMPTRASSLVSSAGVIPVKGVVSALSPLHERCLATFDATPHIESAGHMNDPSIWRSGRSFAVHANERTATLFSTLVHFWTLAITIVCGYGLLDKIGCAACHVETLTTVPAGTKINCGMFTIPFALGSIEFHPYGDFLMHDVGTGDGILEATREHYGNKVFQMMSGYLSEQDFESSRNKIRTAVLWVVRLRPRLMHDGASLARSPPTRLVARGLYSTEAQQRKCVRVSC